MSRAPAPNQLRWMAGRAALLAVFTGVAVAVLFGGLKQSGSAAFPNAFFVGSVAAAISFAVSMLLFLVTMPRMEPRSAVWLSLALGAVAAFLIASLFQPIGHLV